MKLLLTSLFIAIGTLGLSQEAETIAEDLVERSIAAHGLDKLYGKETTFTFRDFDYMLQLRKDGRTYQRKKLTNGDTIVDVLDTSTGFSHKVNGRLIALPDFFKDLYRNSLNSVLYFFQTPLVLREGAVNLEYVGNEMIKGQEYEVLRITFDVEGGGDDYEDEFRYWINKDSAEVDYLAYSYHTNGGGIRFRKAINKRRIEGILFQDYENYKPKDRSVALDSLPGLYEQDKLELLSLIENSDIRISSTVD